MSQQIIWTNFYLKLQSYESRSQVLVHMRVRHGRNIPNYVMVQYNFELQLKIFLFFKKKGYAKYKVVFAILFG